MMFVSPAVTSPLRRLVVAVAGVALIASSCGGSSANDITNAATTGGAGTAAVPAEIAGDDAAMADEPAEAEPATTGATGDEVIHDDQPGMVDEHPELEQPTAAPDPTAAPEPAAPEPTAEPAPAGAVVELPTIEVVDLVTGDRGNLADRAEPGATLIWFWAPH